MPQGAVASQGSSGEHISHFAAIKIRAYGAGQLKMAVYSLDDIIRKVLIPFPLFKAARIIPTRLVNFREQRASFELKTTLINETFRIHRIVIFSKPTDSSYPGS